MKKGSAMGMKKNLLTSRANLVGRRRFMAMKTGHKKAGS
jgi:hypothetical protein